MKCSAGEPRTQTERVLWYMREFGSSRGFNVKKTMKKVVNRYGEACNVAEYSLEEE